MRPCAWLTVLLPIFPACTTVEIAERDAFDVKRTVSEDQLASFGVSREIGRLRVDPKVELSTWRLRRARPRGTLIYFGGNGYVMINGHDILQGILPSPVDVFTHDYRGYGQSNGRPSVSAMKVDALAVYDHVRDELGVPPEEIIVQGQSLGSFVALWVATRRPVAGVIIEAPVTSVDELLDHLAPWWTRAFIQFEVDPALAGEDNLERIEQLEAPLLVIAGEEDPIAHPDMARALFDRAPGPDKRLLVLQKGKHNDLPPREDYQAAHRAFVERVLPPLRIVDERPVPPMAD